jgi:hypothetical protein
MGGGNLCEAMEAVTKMKKRGRPPLFGRAMTVAERQDRYQERRAAEARANIPQWVKDIPALEATAINTTGMLTLKEVLAEIEDAGLRAELLAQAAEDEAALEAEGGDEDD